MQKQCNLNVRSKCNLNALRIRKGIITKRKLKLKLENHLSNKLQFSTDFSQNYIKHSSTNSVAIPTVDVPVDVCIQNES